MAKKTIPQKISKTNLNECFFILQQQNPNPTTELVFFSEFSLLAAVLLSAQNTDKGVNVATQKLFAEHKTPEAISQLTLEQLYDYLKTLNYYKTKAKNLQLTSRIIAEKGMPSAYEELVELPGVGQKTALVFLNCARKEPRLPVDTHVKRMAVRLGFSFSEDHSVIEKDLFKQLNPSYHLNAHHWLILHGRYVCKAIKPKCNECALNHLCPSVNLLNK